ncbi:hypothetical protein KQH65_03910 [archaeon]|nr:hypothetical protein [archaeon]
MEKKTGNNILPKFPRVFAQGYMVIIMQSNGEKNIWGNEVTEKQAKKTAEELEFELRLMALIKKKVETPIDEILEICSQFNHNGLVNELLSEVMWEKVRVLSKKRIVTKRPLKTP